MGKDNIIDKDRKRATVTLTIIRTTLLFFYDEIYRYVTNFAAMTSGSQKGKNAVNSDQRYSYMACPLYDASKLHFLSLFLLISNLMNPPGADKIISVDFSFRLHEEKRAVTNFYGAMVSHADSFWQQFVNFV